MIVIYLPIYSASECSVLAFRHNMPSLCAPARESSPGPRICLADRQYPSCIYDWVSVVPWFEIPPRANEGSVETRTHIYQTFQLNRRKAINMAEITFERYDAYLIHSMNTVSVALIASGLDGYYKWAFIILFPVLYSAHVVYVSLRGIASSQGYTLLYCTIMSYSLMLLGEMSATLLQCFAEPKIDGNLMLWQRYGFLFFMAFFVISEAEYHHFFAREPFSSTYQRDTRPLPSIPRDVFAYRRQTSAASEPGDLGTRTGALATVSIYWSKSQGLATLALSTIVFHLVMVCYTYPIKRTFNPDSTQGSFVHLLLGKDVLFQSHGVLGTITGWLLLRPIRLMNRGIMSAALDFRKFSLSEAQLRREELALATEHETVTPSSNRPRYVLCNASIP